MTLTKLALIVSISLFMQHKLCFIPISKRRSFGSLVMPHESEVEFRVRVGDCPSFEKNFPSFRKVRQGKVHLIDVSYFISPRLKKKRIITFWLKVTFYYHSLLYNLWIDLRIVNKMFAGNDIFKNFSSNFLNNHLVFSKLFSWIQLHPLSWKRMFQISHHLRSKYIFRWVDQSNLEEM